MAGKIMHPLKTAEGIWDPDKVAEVVIERLTTMPTASALALGYDGSGTQRGLPTLSTWKKMLSERPDLAAACAHARKQRAEHLAEEALTILDADPRLTPKGLVDNGAVRHAVARANQRNYMAERLDPERYGKQVGVNLSINGHIDIRQVLAEARGRVIEGRAERLPQAADGDVLDDVQSAAVSLGIDDLLD
jgi:hypothetical protein